MGLEPTTAWTTNALPGYRSVGEARIHWVSCRGVPLGFAQIVPQIVPQTYVRGFDEQPAPDPFIGRMRDRETLSRAAPVRNWKSLRGRDEQLGVVSLQHADEVICLGALGHVARFGASWAHVDRELNAET